MKLIQGMAVLISVLITLALFSVWYLDDRRNGPEGAGKRLSTDQLNSEISEDADIGKPGSAPDIYRFNEPRGAPDFELALLRGPNKRLSEYRGKYVFLTFWATW